MSRPQLRYIGKIEGADHLGIDMRMWNVFEPGKWYHKSTRMLDGLKELGIVG